MGDVRGLSDAVLFVNVPDAAEKGRVLRIAQIRDAMGLHAGDVDKVMGTHPFLFDLSIGLGIVRHDQQAATENIHGLMVEMVVNRDGPSGPDSEEAKPILRSILGTGLRKPPDPDILHLQGFPSIGIGFDLRLVGLLHVFYDHADSPLLFWSSPVL